jgi:hypothetical protein
MTQITGKFVDSGGVVFDGDLTLTLDAPLVDAGTTPDSIYTLNPHTFTFSSGTLSGVSVVESATSNVTYHFVVNKHTAKTTYWLADGTQYDRPVVTDSGNYYTGTFNADPTAGQTPSLVNTAYWQILAQLGDPGGTGGNDTAYDATGWNGAFN